MSDTRLNELILDRNSLDDQLDSLDEQIRNRKLLIEEVLQDREQVEFAIKRLTANVQK